jgi:hypothetical protein
MELVEVTLQVTFLKLKIALIIERELSSKKGRDPCLFDLFLSHQQVKL